MSRMIKIKLNGNGTGSHPYACSYGRKQYTFKTIQEAMDFVDAHNGSRKFTDVYHGVKEATRA